MIVKVAKNAMSDAGLLLMRLSLGAFFAFHGSQKLLGVFGGLGLGGLARLMDGMSIPWPQYFAVGVASVEFFAGIGLILGVWSRTSSGLLALLNLGSAYVAHTAVLRIQLKDVDYPTNLTYLFTGLAVCLMGLAMTGPGRFTCVPLIAKVSILLPRRKPVARVSAEPRQPEPRVPQYDAA